jgi:hypothetical protein
MDRNIQGWEEYIEFVLHQYQYPLSNLAIIMDYQSYLPKFMDLEIVL